MVPSHDSSVKWNDNTQTNPLQPDVSQSVKPVAQLQFELDSRSIRQAINLWCVYSSSYSKTPSNAKCLGATTFDIPENESIHFFLKLQNVARVLANRGRIEWESSANRNCDVRFMRFCSCINTCGLFTYPVQCHGKWTVRWHCDVRSTENVDERWKWA